MTVTANDSLGEARYWLTELRRGADSFMYFFNRLSCEARHRVFTLAELGTSKEELEQLRLRGYQTIAKKLLFCLRRGYGSPYSFIKDLRRLRETISAHHLLLSDLGTTEDELAEMKKAGYKRIATEWLESIRRQNGYFCGHFTYMRDALREGGLSLADIGTTEIELASFKH